MISCCFFQFQFFSLCECVYLLGSITCNIESRCYNPVLSFVLLNVRCLVYGLCTPVFYKSPFVVRVIQKYLFLMEEETVKKGHEKICAPGSTNFSKVSKGINISNFQSQCSCSMWVSADIFWYSLSKMNHLWGLKDNYFVFKEGSKYLKNNFTDRIDLFIDDYGSV